MDSRDERAAVAWLTDEIDNFEAIVKALNPSPGDIPRLDGVDIHGGVLPLKQVIGGDHIIYVDFNRRYDLDTRIALAEGQGRRNVADCLRLNRERAGVLIADVCGHRITDALVAAMLHQAFLLGVRYELDLHGEITTGIFENIKTRFYQSSSVNKYFTMVYGEISQSGRFRFVSAGHPAPLVFSRRFSKLMEIPVERRRATTPVGLFPSTEDVDQKNRRQAHAHREQYTVNEIDLLGSGDCLLLFTDGLVEHGDGEFFPTVFERCLADHIELPAKSICKRLREAIVDYAPREDDISFVVIKRS
jgi:serine phosphatase RsbU (regulator of sigma subunit)